jgi:hypothetical protein
MSGMASPRFEATIVGVRAAVKTAQGLTVPVSAVPKRAICRLGRGSGSRIQDARSPAGGAGKVRYERRGRHASPVGGSRRVDGGCMRRDICPG